MVVKIKPNEIVENKDVKSFYEKQDELINEIRESIKVNGLRNPLVINHENILMDGYVRRDVLLESGKGDEEIDVILVNEESSVEDYILRNSGRTKTDNDLLKEWKYIFFKKYQKRQGRKKNGEPEGTYVENVSRDLGGRFKDDETINRIGFCLKNDLPNNIISKGIIKGTISPVNGNEFLKTFHPIDIDKNYGFTEKVTLGEITVQDAIKLIKQKENLNTHSDTFVIPGKATSYNKNCIELGDMSNHFETVDLLFSSPPYFILRDYKVDGEKQTGKEETKEQYCNKIANLIKASIPTLKRSANVIINIGETYDNGVGYGIPQLLKTYIEQNTGLIYKDQLVWSKPNPKPQNENIKRPINNVEYLLWFVVDPKEAFYKMLTYTIEDRDVKISHGAKDVDKDGKIWDKNISLSKPYQKIYTHIKEQSIVKIIEAKTGKNSEVYSIYKEGAPAIMSGILPIVPILMCSDEYEHNTVLDIFSGSNVVGRMSLLLNRKVLSAELSNDYYNIGCKMLEDAIQDYNREDLDIINKLAYGKVLESELIDAA
jgi:DNA modification methylase